MKNRIIYMLLLGLFVFYVPATAQNKEAWRANVPKPTAARSIEIGDYASFDLKNGLKVIVVENHKLPRVSYQLSLKHDPVLEGNEVGYVSMMGELMKKGTKARTKFQIDEQVDFIGGRLSTFGSGMYGSSLKKHNGTLLDLFTDILYNPAFPKAEFDKMVTQAKSGLASSKADPGSMVSNVSSVINYGTKHPYGEVQNEENLNAIKLATIKKYYNTYFKPNNAYLVIVGDVTVGEAKTLANKYFGQWKSGRIPTANYTAANAPSENRVAVINKDGAVQSMIRVTYPIDLKPGSEDVIKARVMNAVLGGGVFSGRLMQNLREDKAYTYGARSSLNSDDLKGSFAAYASVRNEVTDSSVEQFLYELRRMSTEPVSKEDLTKIKNSIAGGFARSLESPQTIAGFALNTFKYNLPKDYYNTYLQRLEAVDVADVQAMVKKYLRPERANIVIAGSADEISDKLKRFDGDGVIEYFDAFGRKIEKSNKKVSSDVTVDDVMNNYFKAVGGSKENLEAVKSMTVKSSMNIMGQDATTEMYKQTPKFAMEVKVGGNVMQSIKYDGMKGQSAGMGGNQIITDPEKLEEIKSQGEMFSGLNYKSGKGVYTLKGIDVVNKSDAYKVEVKNKNSTTINYYDVKTGLLVKSATTAERNGQSITSTTYFKDYKKVDGFMMPYKMEVEGMMPMPLEMKIDEYKINPSIPASTFMIR